MMKKDNFGHFSYLYCDRWVLLCLFVFVVYLCRQDALLYLILQIYSFIIPIFSYSPLDPTKLMGSVFYFRSHTNTMKK